jgi:hypothetical protein
MELQAIFNKAHNHFKTMGAPSMAIVDGGNSCSYRGDGGAMCAVGLFITDEHYSDTLEGNGIQYNNGSGLDSNVQKAVAYSFKQHRLSDEQLSLLSALQDVHDNHSEDKSSDTFDNDPTAWYQLCEWSLRSVATKFGLKFNQPA